ncbi:MlaE family ABC transporter permease [Aquabacterium sp.]|uniref:MlaE family ABC transporter permease n=1 Tax=Aquabacterium sp. TaxID=1872578 RepID=UPI002CF3E402|nr:ABC transporter permease [Aquabacterium sp.]HSW08654.1 ABC transporter permease [Aquabacterium sp.]
MTSSGPSPRHTTARARALLSRSLGQWWRMLHFGAEMLTLAGRHSSYRGDQWPLLARQIVQATLPNLWWFILLAALASLVITRIVVVTALSYGLSRYALEMVIRVLVLELIPLAAAFFIAIHYALPAGAEIVALRSRGVFDDLRRRGLNPAQRELVPRVLAGIFAVLTLAAAAGVVALVLAYVVVHGFSPWGLPGYTRTVGHVLSPAVALVFLLKTLFFSLAVSLVPPASAMTETTRRARSGPELQGLFRMLAAMVLIELGSLMVNYI